MSSAALLLVSIAVAAQSPTPFASRTATGSPCSQVSADALTDVAVGEVCAGDEAARSGVAPFDAPARVRAWRTAAEHYRRAATLSSKVATRVVALNALANLYDTAHLDDIRQMEGALRELVALNPDDLSPLYRLASVQENHGLVDAAEDTLQLVKRQRPDTVEPYSALAAFYARQAAARRKPTEFTTQAGSNEKQVYRIGGDIRPPQKLVDVRPQQPPEAAEVRGVVIIEVTINEAGNVSNSRVLRSIPALDLAALDAVRQWRFTPTMVNGQAVPVLMTVTVNF